MPIGSQFTGLDMKELIGGPLSAAADASVQLAQSTAEFINDVGFDEQKKVRNVQFGYTKKNENPDGSISNDDMNVNVPLLAIVPIPNLQIDEVNILFDMEVKESQKSESSKDYGGSFTGTANFGIFKATVSGSVSAHESNTRSSDNSAKYHVDVRATNHGTPEGLSRVLDMMSACIAPELLGSTIVGEDGKALEGQRKERAQKLKQLQAEIMACNKKTNAAKDSMALAIERLKKKATSCQNQYLAYLSVLMSKLDDSEESKEKLDNYQQMKSQVSMEWGDFIQNTQDRVDMIESLNLEQEDDIFTQHILLTCINSEGNTDIVNQELKNYFHLAIEAKKQVTLCQEDTNSKQDEYNRMMYGG